MKETNFGLGQTQIFDIFGESLRSIAAILPSLAAVILILLFGYLFAKMFSKLVAKAISKSGIDRQAEKLNNIELFSSTNIKVVPSILLSKLFYYLCMLFVIIAAADLINMPTITQIIRDVINLIPQLLTALFIILFGIFVSDALRKIVQSTCESLGIPSSKLISGFVFYFLIINILLTALEQAGIETQSLSQNISLLIGGLILAFAIGYGLASKDIFANILNSYYNRELFQIGDVIRWKEYQGTVIDLDRSRITLEIDQSESVIIPMNKLSREEIVVIKSINYTNDLKN
ncbi:mechanosensitive ion channel family protein [Membranihabitans marinus]|uniref:mechanosensitive ion channel family protein n=1 Tax=Membranihabitans marinus TaxID=1227546 RepID=UPI001F010AB8|nr:mechanosensitive ion channel domain-containing protein [Membranihabitans marinus]